LTLQPSGFTYIATDAELQQAANEWAASDCIALDTEFMRVSTFYPQAALFQIATRDKCFLIDPLPISDFTPLVELLENPGIVKIMHACSEDLEVFSTFLKCQSQAIYDTQIGAAFLGYGLSIGYKNLMDTLFDVDLPKGEQRSDWLQRPLTDKQLAYAAQDVTYLIEVYHQQRKTLTDKGWFSWVEEEIQALLNKQRRNVSPADAYLRVKGANRMTLDQVQVIQRLAEWREVEARSRDIPRGFILKDPQILGIAQALPSTSKELSRTEDIRRRVVFEDGERILELVAQGEPSKPQVPAFSEPLPPRAKPLIKDLQALLIKIAEAADLIPELLLNRKTLVSMLTELMNSGEATLPADLPGWKKALFGDELLSALADMKGRL